MPTKWETFPIKFQGGLITNVNRLEQGTDFPGSATILQNYEPDIREGYTRILGYSKFSQEVVPGSGLITSVVTLTNSEVLALRGGVWNFSSGTTWASKLTQTIVAANRSDSDSFNFNGVIKTVVVDGVNAPAYFNHVTKDMTYATSPVPEVIGANRVTVFQSHVFFAKGHLLTFTVPFNEEDFRTSHGAGVVNVGDEIVGLQVFRNQLIIFCLNKIFRLSGTSVLNFQLESITDNTGCLCGHTIQEVGGDIMYLGPDGIRFLSASERQNDFGLERASERIQKDIIQMGLSDCLYNSVTIAAKGQYRIFSYIDNIPRENSGGFVGTQFSNQSASRVEWASLKGFKIYSLSKHTGRNTETILFSSDQDYIFRMESGNSFDGEDIESIFETPYMSVNDPKIRKTFYKHTVYVRPAGPLEVGASLKFDYGKSDISLPSGFFLSSPGGFLWGGASTIWGEFLYSPPEDKEFFNNVIGSGLTVALRYYDKSQRPPHNLNFALLEYRTNERR
jgi:hypothetical protein